MDVVLPLLLALITTCLIGVRIAKMLGTRDAPVGDGSDLAIEPPPGATPAPAVRMWRDANDQVGIPGEILDLAVKGVWQLGVRTTDGRRVWSARRDTAREPYLQPVPDRVYHAVFPPGSTALEVDITPPGPKADRTDYSRRSAAFIDAVRSAGAQVDANRWVARHSAANLMWPAVAGGAVAVAALFTATLSGMMAQDAFNPWLLMLGYAGFGGLAVGFIPMRRWSYTADGRRVQGHLDALKRFMTLSDAERAQRMQGGRSDPGAADL